jgi:vancomycin resistance protein VanW
VTPSQRHPWLRPVAVRAHRTRRRLQWLTSGATWATAYDGDALPVEVWRHASPLRRELVGAGRALQDGKVVNLRLASARLDGLLIRPGETLSFNRAVGNCTRRKGYVDGLRLAGGVPVAGVGGGLCQLANLLHWLVLHSPLTVADRSEHSVDPFPDRDRVVPWGVGCTIVYNYVDLVLRNDTTATFQLRFRVAEPDLLGELLVDRPLATTYEIVARDEEFVRLDGAVHRRNEIWRQTTDTRTGEVAAELVRRNCARVLYDVEPARVVRS